MEKYDIRGIELNWFKSHLLNRRQRTKINNIVSDAVNVNLDVTQYHYLESCFFSAHKKIIKFSKLVLFADDALLFISADSADECIDKLNYDLDKLQTWFEMNELEFNLRGDTTVRG